MARFVVVLPLEPLAAGDAFAVADWPLHVTLVEPFSVESATTDVIAALHPVAAGADVVRASAGHDALFGRRHDVPVALVHDGGGLTELRERALTALGGIGVAIGRSHREFRPHVTHRPHGRVRFGERLDLGCLTLIDMRPAEGSGHRRVVAAWHLGRAEQGSAGS